MDNAHSGIRYCVEPSAWSIAEDGASIVRYLTRAGVDYPVSTISSPRDWRNQVIHFGSLWSFAGHVADAHPSNRLITTVFHGSETMEPAMAPGFQMLRQHLGRLDHIVISCTIMEKRLRDWGVPSRKLHLIPLGVDTEMMRPTASPEKERLRRSLGIPTEAFCVGSFQKDGNGWDEGLEPKQVKGPDILLETLALLAGRIPLFVLLTGPARGYVKAGLERLGIPYRHDRLEDLREVVSRYAALDAYLVSSREEGGPKAVLEAMACGIPLVTTRVGMAADIVRHRENGWMAGIDDVQGLAEGLTTLATDLSLATRLAKAGTQTAALMDWRHIIKQYQVLYAPLIQLLQEQG